MTSPPDASNPWLDPSFGAVALVLTAAVTAYLLFVLPLQGKRRYDRLLAAGASGAASPLRYRRRLIMQGVWTAVVLAVLATKGVDRTDLGVRLPRGAHAAGAWEWTAYTLAVLVIGGVIMRRRSRAGRTVPGQRAFEALLPNTPAERRTAALVAVGAGVSEELLFRGLLVAAGVGILGWPALASLLASSIVFGWCHLYQGRRQTIALAVVGLVLGLLYLASESLLLPILVHMVMDLRALVLVPRQRADARDRAH